MGAVEFARCLQVWLTIDKAANRLDLGSQIIVSDKAKDLRKIAGVITRTQTSLQQGRI